MKTLVCLSSIGFALTSSAETLSGDITAAVRESGKAQVYQVMPQLPDGTLCAHAAGVGDDFGLFNGIKPDERYLLNDGFSETKPFVVYYQIPDDFLPDEDIVMQGISFLAVAKADGSPWGSSQARLPIDFSIEASNDGQVWTRICTRIGYTAIKNNKGTDDKLISEERRCNFVNWASYRRYRIYVTKTGAAAEDSWPIQIGEIQLHGRFGGTIEPSTQTTAGDLTQAVRDCEGYNLKDLGLTVSHADDVNGEPATTFFDGNKSDYESAVRLDTDQAQRYMIKNESLATKPEVVLTYDVPDYFHPGENVVLTGIAFEVGSSMETAESNPDKDREMRLKFGNPEKRAPTSFRIEGFVESGDWVTIIEYGTDEFKSGNYKVFKHTHSKTGVEYEDYTQATAVFANMLGARRYRVILTGSDVTNDKFSDTYAYQLSEVMLYGVWGEKVTFGLPTEKIDITAAVRAERAGTAACSVGEHSSPDNAYSPDNAFDGIYGSKAGDNASGAGSYNRFLSNPVSAEDFAADRVWLSYAISPGFYNGADIVVTEYTMDVWIGFGLGRLPKDWKLQGSSDGEEWTTIDERKGFFAWDTVARTDANGILSHHYVYTFRFKNSRSFRRYRILYGALCDATADRMQFSEVVFRGYVGTACAGKVGQDEDETLPISITTALVNMSCGLIACSKYDDETPNLHHGTPESLFDGKYASAFLARLGKDGDERAYAPLTFTFALSDQLCPGKEIVLTKYRLSTSDFSGVGNWAGRAPVSWRLEGLHDGRWIKIDSRSKYSFDKWDEQAVTEGTKSGSVFSAEFEIPEGDGRRFACRQYRLKLFEPAETSSFGGHDAMLQVLLCEIALEGVWGDQIGETPKDPLGLLFSVR